MFWGVLGQPEFQRARLIPGIVTSGAYVYGCERVCRRMRRYLIEWTYFVHQIRGSGGTGSHRMVLWWPFWHAGISIMHTSFTKLNV